MCCDADAAAGRRSFLWRQHEGMDRPGYPSDVMRFVDALGQQRAPGVWEEVMHTSLRGGGSDTMLSIVAELMTAEECELDLLAAAEHRAPVTTFDYQVPHPLPHPQAS
jgi:hypothetical protein